jgi:hypothetical protein
MASLREQTVHGCDHPRLMPAEEPLPTVAGEAHRRLAGPVSAVVGRSHHEPVLG